MPNKTIAFVTALFLAATHLWWLPYAQQSANSHMNSGPIFAFLTLGLALVIALPLLWRPKAHAMLLFPITTLLYSAYTLSHLMCTGCLNGG